MFLKSGYAVVIFRTCEKDGMTINLGFVAGARVKAAGYRKYTNTIRIMIGIRM